MDVSDLGIGNLAGIEYFISLVGLYCDWNRLTSLDVSKNLYLVRLVCSENFLTQIDVSFNTKLTSLAIDGNYLPSKSAIKGLNENRTYLDFGQQYKDITADFKDPNFLEEVRRLTDKTKGEPIFASDVNKIKELDISGKNITYISGIEHFTGLEKFNCSDNQGNSIYYPNNTSSKKLQSNAARNISFL